MRAQGRTIKTDLEYRSFGIFRLLLAVLVVAQHVVAALAPEPIAILIRPLEIGSIAVLVFFALSGFVIVEAAESVYQGRPDAFLTNRLLRVFPHFLLAVLIALFVYGAVSWAGTDGVRQGEAFVVDQAFMARNIVFNFLSILPLADRFVSFNFVPIAWAVRVEVAFYLAIAAGLGLMALMRAVTSGRSPLLSELLLLVCLPCLPLWVLAIHGYGIGMFQFLPYFAFGGALFYCVRNGSVVAHLVAGLSLAGMITHFLMQPPHHAVAGFERDVAAQFVLLLGLLAVMSLLALLPSQKVVQVDRALGNLTYPLYMHHMNVIIVAYLFLPEYTLRSMILAAGLSLIAAFLFHRLLDPLVDRLRNRVRGRTV